MIGLITLNLFLLIVFGVFGESKNSGFFSTNKEVSDEHFINFLLNQQPYPKRNRKHLEKLHDKYVKIWMEREKTAEMLKQQRENGCMSYYEE